MNLNNDRSQVLEERLNDKKEQLLEKDLVLEEVSNLANRLRSRALEGREDTLELAKRVNDLQAAAPPPPPPPVRIATTRRALAAREQSSPTAAPRPSLQNSSTHAKDIA